MSKEQKNNSLIEDILSMLHIFSPINMEKLKKTFIDGVDSLELKKLSTDIVQIFNQEISQEDIKQLTPECQGILIVNFRDKKDRILWAKKTKQFGLNALTLKKRIDFEINYGLGKAVSNFHDIFEKDVANLLQQDFKNKYVIDFLSINEKIKELELEKKLFCDENRGKTLLELGDKFYFQKKQAHFHDGARKAIPDITLTHKNLYFYLVIELKMGKFLPEHAGKMNYYLNLVNQKSKSDEDNPSIGLILCKSKNDETVKLSLKNINNPIVVAEWQEKID